MNIINLIAFVYYLGFNSIELDGTCSVLYHHEKFEGETDNEKIFMNANHIEHALSMIYKKEDGSGYHR